MGLYRIRNAAVLGGISGNGDWESAFCRVVSEQRGKERFLNEVCTQESSCPFPSARQQSPPPSCLLQPACFSGRNSRVAASFFRCFRRVSEQRERCPDLPFSFFFFFAQLSHWTISRVHREKGGGAAVVDFARRPRGSTTRGMWLKIHAKDAALTAECQAAGGVI